MTDHLARAKDHIAKGNARTAEAEGHYRKAAEEIVAAKEDQPELTWGQIAQRVECSERQVHRLMAAFRNPDARFTVDWNSGSNKRDEVTATTLGKADDDTLASIVSNLPPGQIEKLVTKGTDVLVENARARKAEHITEPTADDLMGGDRFDPAEYWADTLVIRVNRNARELAGLMKRAGGLLFGTMPPDEAFDYLHEAERLIAEARAAAQEQVRDGVEV